MSEECKTCLGPHDAEVHSATVSIHRWLRARLRRLGEPVPPPKPRSVLPPGCAGVTNLSLLNAAARQRASRRGGLGAKGARGQRR